MSENTLQNPQESIGPVRRVVVFFVLAYLITWLAILILQWIAAQSGVEHFSVLIGMAETTFDLGAIAERLAAPPVIIWLLSRLVDFGPSIAALITAGYFAGRAGVGDLLRKLVMWRVALRWYLIALFLPPALMLLAIGLHLALGETAVQRAEWRGLETVAQALFWVLIARTLLGGGLGEELGWRGYALPGLMPRFSAVRASLIISLV